MAWFIGLNRLDRQQQSYLQEFNKSKNTDYWLKGYAGSGKTVLLIHSLINYKEEFPNAKVIIVVYTLALIDMIKSGLPEEYKNTPVVTYHQFKKSIDDWDLALVDEIQDLPVSNLHDLRNKAKRIIVAGDVNQSIYDNVATSNDIKEIIKGNEFNLDIIHRISKKIRSVAQFFCSDRNGFNTAEMGKLVELEPRLIQAKSIQEEIEWLALSAEEYARTGYAPAILIPKHNLIFDFFQEILRLKKLPLLNESWNNKNHYDRINQHLREHNLKYQYLGNGTGNFMSGIKDSLVTVMTYHSAKGLDFKAVFIPFINQNLEIWHDDVRAKALFFVALTRSREQLFLSYEGIKHPFLNQIPEQNFHLLNASDELKRMKNPMQNQIEDTPPSFIF